MNVKNIVKVIEHKLVLRVGRHCRFREFLTSTENSTKFYSLNSTGNNMVQCSRKQCVYQWFHYNLNWNCKQKNFNHNRIKGQLKVDLGVRLSCSIFLPVLQQLYISLSRSHLAHLGTLVLVGQFKKINKHYFQNET